MCFKDGGAYEPYADAIKVFENGHGLINAYREKYGVSYRVVIRKALRICDKAQKKGSKNDGK